MGVPEITIIDYGVGNLLSVRRGFEHCGASVTITSDPTLILKSHKVVLPGVGAFANGMRALKKLRLVPVIREIAEQKIPLLGICLGMQLLMEESEEFGVTAGLGLIPGRVIPVPAKSTEGLAQKIPHVGWSRLQISVTSSTWINTILQDVSLGESVYFVHSYMAEPTETADRIAECNYGGHQVAAVIERENIAGCQFHPEKSGEVGLKILKRFCID